MNLPAILPELALAAACIALVTAAGFVRGRGRAAIGWAALAVLVVAAALTARMLGREPTSAFHGIYVVDPTATAMKLLAEAGAILTMLLLLAYFRGREPIAYAPVALVFATLGAVLLASVAELGVLLLALELTSFASYLLVAQVRGDGRALEATLKYLLFGIFALAVMGYGLSFVYGLTGSLGFEEVGAALAGADRAWVALALAVVLVGFGFEIAAAPFHFWMPDALEGATAPVSGFVSVVPKVGAFAALLRFLVEAMPGETAGWPWMLSALAALTMTVGNLAALRQASLKRLLAWSSVAQAGYVLLAVAVAERADGSVAATALYLGAYVFMNLGAFGVAAQVERALGTDRLEALDGLGRRAPLAAVALALSLLSLAGIPPLAGFAGKVLVLEAALDGHLGWLAVIAAANWVVALSYYLRPIARVAFEPARGGPLSTGPWSAAHALSIAGTLALGVLPGAVLRALRLG